MFLFFGVRNIRPFNGSQARSKILYLCLYFGCSFFLLMFFILKQSALLCKMYSIILTTPKVSNFSSYSSKIHHRNKRFSVAGNFCLCSIRERTI